jgi:hypothetical protein
MPRSPGSTVGLPGFSWDDKLRNYVDNDTGRMVKRSDITDLLRDTTKASEDRMAQLGSKFANNDISPRAFYEAMQQEIKLATNTNAALAKGGWAQLTQADRDANEAQIRQEYARLWQFARDKQDGLLSPAQIEARANLYANSTYSRYWEITTEEQRERGMTQERLVTMGDDRVCEECQGEAANGWVMIGTYNPPIHPGCRCDVEYNK